LSYRLRGAQWVSALKGAARISRRRLSRPRSGDRVQRAARVLPERDPPRRPARLIGPGAYDSLTTCSAGRAEGRAGRASSGEDSSTRNQAGSAIALAIGIVAALWAASGATGSVIKAVNRASELEETRPFWKTNCCALPRHPDRPGHGSRLPPDRLRRPLGDAIARRAHLGHWFVVLWGAARWPIAFGGILSFFSIVYYVARTASRGAGAG
jgi:hypothetical protein